MHAQESSGDDDDEEEESKDPKAERKHEFGKPEPK